MISGLIFGVQNTGSNQVDIPRARKRGTVGNLTRSKGSWLKKFEILSRSGGGVIKRGLDIYLKNVNWGWEGNLGKCEFGRKLHANEKTKGVLGMRKMLNTVEYRPSGIYAYLNT